MDTSSSIMSSSSLTPDTNRRKNVDYNAFSTPGSNTKQQQQNIQIRRINKKLMQKNLSLLEAQNVARKCCRLQGNRNIDQPLNIRLKLYLSGKRNFHARLVNLPCP